MATVSSRSLDIVQDLLYEAEEEMHETRSFYPWYSQNVADAEMRVDILLEIVEKISSEA